MRLNAQLPRYKRRGVTIVEFSVVCLLCLMVILGIIEYGRILWVKQILDNAAREGARYAVVHTNDQTTLQVQNYVKQRMAGQDVVLGATILVYEADPNTGANLGAWTNASFGLGIAVEIDVTLRPIIPRLFFLPTTVSLTGRSVMYSEAN